MKTKMTTILRFGLGITFIWIGYLIWQSPEAWASFLPAWVTGIMPVSAKLFMQSVAIFDLAIGVLLLINKFVSYAALLGSLHLFGVIFVMGFNGIAARDFGLAMASLALFMGTKRG